MNNLYIILGLLALVVFFNRNSTTEHFGYYDSYYDYPYYTGYYHDPPFTKRNCRRYFPCRLHAH